MFGLRTGPLDDRAPASWRHGGQEQDPCSASLPGTSSPGLQRLRSTLGPGNLESCLHSCLRATMSGSDKTPRLSSPGSSTVVCSRRVFVTLDSLNVLTLQTCAAAKNGKPSGKVRKKSAAKKVQAAMTAPCPRSGWQLPRERAAIKKLAVSCQSHSHAVVIRSSEA